MSLLLLLAAATGVAASLPADGGAIGTGTRNPTGDLERLFSAGGSPNRPSLPTLSSRLLTLLDSYFLFVESALCLCAMAVDC